MQTTTRLIIPALLTILLFFGPTIPTASAETTFDKLSEIQDKLKSKLREVTETKKEEESIQGTIGDMDKQINSKKKELQNYDKRIADAEAGILALSDDINLINDSINNRKHYLKERILAIYKRQYGGKALILVSAKDHQDLLRKSNYLSLMAHYDKTILDEYSSKVQEINRKKHKLKALREGLVSEKNFVMKKRKDLQSDRTKKNRLLASVKARKKEQEKKIKDLEKSSSKLQSLIKGLKTKKIPQALLGKGFKSLKGTLPWPVEGSITAPFGKHFDPELNTTYFKKGIEIRTGHENFPQAVAGGRVVYSGNFTGYGKVLIIDHGGRYHTLYGNLSDISLKTGELLAKGMDIGKAVKLKSTNFTTLYFEIRYKGKPVDPMIWLKTK